MTPATPPLPIHAAGVLAMLLAASPAPARSETLATPSDLQSGSRLAAYFLGPEQARELYAVGRHWDAKLGLQRECKAPYNVQPLNLFLLKPIDFPENRPHPVAGAWQRRFVFERCGKRMTYNAIFLARHGDKPEARPYIPGTGNASPVQVADALKGAYASAVRRLARDGKGKGCGEAELIETRLVQPPTPGASWEESWTFRGCGRDLEIGITFSPDGKDGTFYSIKDDR